MTDPAGFTLQFTQGLQRALQLHPERPATLCNGRRQSYRQLAERVARLAGALRALGAGAGERVAILALNSDRYLEYYLAVPWAGAMVNPINFRWSTAEIAYALNDSNSRLLFVDDHFVDQIEPLLAACASLEAAIFCGEGPCPPHCLALESLIASQAPAADAGRGGEDTFGVFYTGGTTGRSKGVLLSHAAILTSAMGPIIAGLYRGHGISLHAAPMFHLADLTQTAGQVLLGGTQVFLAQYRPEQVLGLIQAHRISDLLMVPAMLQLLLDHPALAATDLSSVRNVIYGASPASETLIDRLLAAFPGTRFHQVYGMTETAGTISLLAPEDHDPARRSAGRIRSVGRSFCHALVSIVDHLDGTPAPCGQVGEILVRGPHIMQGYLRQPEATAATLREGWLHTGDLGYLDAEGYLFIVDRLKDMIVSGGENIYCNEVEHAIASHPAVAACAVIGIPSAEWGESVHACVVLKADAPGLELADLTEHCQRLIAGYKCPRSLQLLASLPLSGAGKLLKTELRKAFWDGRERGVN